MSKAPVVAYPNPAQSHITLRLSEAYQGDSELQVSNLLGSTVMQKKLKNKGAEKLELEVGQLKPGVYLYRLQLADQSFTGKFSIAR
ncbi:MAG: T9SS type A sorting domain-containing protein [Owenweeksia sp.]|nr:T9SS type A sorting domain-containing protein [Owenweeksia sp.]